MPPLPIGAQLGPGFRPLALAEVGTVGHLPAVAVAALDVPPPVIVAFQLLQVEGSEGTTLVKPRAKLT